MAHIIEDRVLEVSTSTGTGPFTLSGAIAGFRRVGAVCSVSDTLWYYIEAIDADGTPTGEYEYGLGTYSASDQLTRTAVRGSSNGGAAVAFATGSKLVGIGVPAPSSAQVKTEWRNALRGASVALASGATVNTDAAAGTYCTLTLATNATLANPTNLVDGMTLMWRIKQDGTGSRTLAYGSKFKFPGGTAPVLSTAAGSVDIMSGIYNAADDRIECNMLKAFA